MSCSFNINDCIKVKLTDYGYKLHVSHYRKYFTDAHLQQYCLPFRDKEGYTKYQLWEFMNIFGEHMYNGADQVIQDNLIYFIEGTQP